MCQLCAKAAIATLAMTLAITGCYGRNQDQVVTLDGYYAEASSFESQRYRDVSETGFHISSIGSSARYGYRLELAAEGVLIHRKLTLAHPVLQESDFYKELIGLYGVVRAYDVALYSQEDDPTMYLEWWLIKPESDLMDWFVARHADYFPQVP